MFCLPSIFLLQQITLTDPPHHPLHPLLQEKHYFCQWCKNSEDIPWFPTQLWAVTTEENHHDPALLLQRKTIYIRIKKCPFILLDHWFPDSWGFCFFGFFFLPAHWMVNSHSTIHWKYRKEMISCLDFKDAELPLNRIWMCKRPQGTSLLWDGFTDPTI